MLRQRRNWAAVGLILAAVAITILFRRPDGDSIGTPWKFYNNLEAMEACRTSMLMVVADTVDVYTSTIGDGFLGGA
ncbi:MAG: hypothetical protein GY852_00400, partial [bacterium]|nr:hypothetical protein [bacterium]